MGGEGITCWYCCQVVWNPAIESITATAFGFAGSGFSAGSGGVGVGGESALVRPAFSAFRIGSESSESVSIGSRGGGLPGVSVDF